MKGGGGIKKNHCFDLEVHKRQLIVLDLCSIGNQTMTVISKQ